MTFPHTATVQRKTEAGGKYTFGNSGTIACFLQPLSNEDAQLYGLTVGKSFYCYVALSEDVNEKDRLLINSEHYGVKGVKQHNYGNLKHKRLILEQL